MKKIFIGFLGLLLTFSAIGCEKVEDEGDYFSGTYFGYTQSESYGETYTTTAVISVDKTGMIASVFIDSTYLKDGIVTTKKALGEDYNMKETSANIGEIEGGAEWDEQMKSLEEKIIEEQGLSFVSWKKDDSTKLDSVSGVTINATDVIKAIENALSEAKK